MICSSRFCTASAICEIKARLSHRQTDLEALVLENSLDCSVFSAGGQFGLEDNAEGAISDNLALRVGQVFVFASLAVLDFLPDDLCGLC